MLQYLRVVKLMAKIWLRFISPRKVCLYGMGEVGLLLGKLDTTLREMRYRFIGLSKEEELHVLELILLNFILRLSSVEVYYDFTTLKNLHSTLSRVEFLHEELSIQPSNFVTELKKSLHEIGFSTDGPFYTPFLIQKLVEFFSLKQFVFCGKLKHIIAELDVHDNDFENPFHFISGLPVGIPLEITLYNISRENRLWLQLAVDETLTEFVFLDLERFGGSNQIRKFTFVAPFYKTPKANSFSMRVYIGMECLSEDVYSFKRRGGPKRELVFLCKEKEVFLSMGVKE
ncbi:protein SIEL-like [Camellia sinensis]|nr:protein SIEL-like [Camellia sinensis]